ncbi:MAG: four helix bundle protein [Candidatus Dojkabacteria bacterium]|nr:four helix bundle protein [Candidatus Dojkabacteria bacterium]
MNNKNDKHIFSFENLEVWQLAVELNNKVFELTKEFPKTEEYSLTSQIRRSALSVSLNIAEGKGRYHKKEFVQFLYLSRGSLYEVITCIRIAQQREYINKIEDSSIITLCSNILSKLSGLINYLKGKL